MSNRKHDPGCGDCNGTGQIVLFTSSKICECVDSNHSFASDIDSTNDFGEYLGKYGDFRYHPKKDFVIKPIESCPKKHRFPW